VKPQLSNKQTDLPPAPPESPPAHFEDGEIIDTGGLPVGFALVATQTLDFIAADLCDGRCTGFGNGELVFDADGNLLAFNGQAVTAVQMGGNDGITAWGTFLFDSTRSAQPLVHFVAGLPSDVSALGGTKGTYSLIGATPLLDALNVTVGALTSATLTVNFGAPNSVTADMTWTISGAPFSASLTGSGSGVNGFPIPLSDVKVSPVPVSGDLLFFGPEAARAGMVYDIDSTLIGAAAFRKQ